MDVRQMERTEVVICFQISIFEPLETTQVAGGFLSAAL